MRGRQVGASVVAGAVLLAVLIPNVGDRSVPGRAQPIQVRLAPAIGDCLLTPPTFQRDLRGGTQVIVADEQTQVGPCDGARYGEVAAIVAANGSYTGASSSGRVDLGEAGSAVDYVCQDLAKDFQGMPRAVWVRYANRWEIFAEAWVVPLRPDAQQQAAGQTWTACLTVPPIATGELMPYSTSLRDAYITGTPSPGFGQCANIADLDTALLSVPCSEPHKVENFGSTMNLFAGTDPDRQKLETSCVELVALLTRFPDPQAAFDGSLQISADLVHYDEDGVIRAGVVTDPLTQQIGAHCTVTALPGRTLSGSLVGLGDQPLPWTG